MRVACMCASKRYVRTIMMTYNFFHTGVTSPLSTGPGLQPCFFQYLGGLMVHALLPRRAASIEGNTDVLWCHATLGTNPRWRAEGHWNQLHEFHIGQGGPNTLVSLIPLTFSDAKYIHHQTSKNLPNKLGFPRQPFMLACTTKIPRSTTSSQAMHLEQILRRPYRWAPWRPAQQQAGTHVRQGLGEDLCTADIQWLQYINKK